MSLTGTAHNVVTAPNLIMADIVRKVLHYNHFYLLNEGANKRHGFQHSCKLNYMTATLSGIKGLWRGTNLRIIPCLTRIQDPRFVSLTGQKKQQQRH